MAINTIGFIGLGLIGGSLAKTIRRVYPEMTLIGYNRTKANLAAALEDGTLTQAVGTVNEAFSECDMVFLCAPVDVNVRCMRQLKEFVRPDCILTDVGSVKTVIHEAVTEMGLEKQFIGGHPMAGSERFGYAAATDRLLENAYFILTPTEQTAPEKLEEYRQLVEGIGSLPVIMDYREHDRVTAAISHLPHVIAYTLVNLVKDSDGEDSRMRMLAAGGFRDITRIASSSPDMWQQICDENREALLELLEKYQADLTRMGEAIRSRDSDFLWKEFEKARVYRNTMPQSRGRDSMSGPTELYVDVDDEKGILAVITAILNAADINVRNMRIMNNREHQNGVLLIEVQNTAQQKKAVEALRRRNFTVYIEN